MQASEMADNNDEITRLISGPVKALRWNVKNGAFVLQYATDAVVFDQGGQFKRMETMWIDVPIVDNAPAHEPAAIQHVSDIAANINQGSETS